MVHEIYLWDPNENFFSQALTFLGIGLVLVATQWLFWLDKDALNSIETNISLNQAIAEIKAIFREKKLSRGRISLIVAALFLLATVNLSYDFKTLKSNVQKTIDEKHISSIQFLPDNYTINIKLPIGFIFSNDSTAKIYLESDGKIAVLEYQVSSLSSFFTNSFFSKDPYKVVIEPNRTKNITSLLALGLQ